MHALSENACMVGVLSDHDCLLLCLVVDVGGQNGFYPHLFQVQTDPAL